MTLVERLKEYIAFEIGVTWPADLIGEAITKIQEQAKSIKELEKFRDQAFEAHPNIDIDIEALFGQENDGY